jgi:hypothetical protein
VAWSIATIGRRRVVVGRGRKGKEMLVKVTITSSLVTAAASIPLLLGIRIGAIFREHVVPSSTAREKRVLPDTPV